MNVRRSMVVGGALLTLVGLMSTPLVLFGGDQPKAKELIQQNCVQCHRMEGQADSRFNLKAPDLIWAGSKYNRAWLIRWLTGKEAPLYVKGYRWDQSQEAHKHVTVSEAEANGIADYFDEHNTDPRVKVGAFDTAKVSKYEVTFGGWPTRRTPVSVVIRSKKTAKLIGGQQSIALEKAGQRYNMDWLFRFGQNPQDFIIHTGEFLADATEPQLRAVIGYLAAQGVSDFKYYEPWDGAGIRQGQPGARQGHLQGVLHAVSRSHRKRRRACGRHARAETGDSRQYQLQRGAD